MSRNLFIVVSHGRYVRVTSKIQVNFRFCRNSRVLTVGLMDFCNFFIPYVFEVKESISRGFTKLPCSGDLENLSQLPVSEVLQGTVDLVLWISVISTFLTISMSRNLFFVVLHNRSFECPRNSRSTPGFAGIRGY